MKTAHSFIEDVIRTAEQRGHEVKINRDGLRQIDFDHKQLHEEHLKSLFPAILASGANISFLIESVAPGRPCAHRPMKEILAQLQSESEQETGK